MGGFSWTDTTQIEVLNSLRVEPTYLTSAPSYSFFLVSTTNYHCRNYKLTKPGERRQYKQIEFVAVSTTESPIIQESSCRISCILRAKRYRYNYVEKSLVSKQFKIINHMDLLITMYISYVKLGSFLRTSVSGIQLYHAEKSLFTNWDGFDRAECFSIITISFGCVLIIHLSHSMSQHFN